MDNKLCKIDGCNRVILARMYCVPHYKRFRRSGFVSISLRPVITMNKHNLARHPLYKAWESMRRRCNDKNSLSYPSYGGRGIIVCDRWQDNFANFLEDMGERPEGLTLDRIDNDGNYEPGNCKWSTKHEQAQNRRINPRNTSGTTGVSYQKNQGTWRMTFERNGIRIRSTHRTLEEAVNKRKKLEEYP